MLTPADLRVRREALGLPQHTIATLAGVQDRAVRRWEAGDSPIPDDVARILDGLEDRTDALIDSTIEAAEDLAAEHGAPASADLTTYHDDASLWAVHPGFAPLPASWHRMMLARVRDGLSEPVRFRYGAANDRPHPRR